MTRKDLPARTADTMSDAIALSSPSGRISKRAKLAAQKRLSVALFGPNGLQQEPTIQPSEYERLRLHAQRLRELAQRGMNTSKFTKEAEKIESQLVEMVQS